MSFAPPSMPSPRELLREESKPSQRSIGMGSGPLLLLAITMVIATAIAVGGMFFFGIRLNNRVEQMRNTLESIVSSQGETLQMLHNRLVQMEERAAGLQGQFAGTSDRLGTAENELRRTQQTASRLVRQQRESTERLAGQLGQVQQEQVATKGAVGGLATEVVGVKEEVRSTREELKEAVSATRSELQRAIGDLAVTTRAELQRMIGDMGVQSDLIARNQTELEELRRRGEREYFEFDLQKSSRRQRIGSIQLELKKTDVKNQKYTVNLIADDRTVEKRDKTVFEAVQFYQEGSLGPTEIVVQQIYKDRIVGYVSVPHSKPERSSLFR